MIFFGFWKRSGFLSNLIDILITFPHKGPGCPAEVEGLKVMTTFKII